MDKKPKKSRKKLILVVSILAVVVAISAAAIGLIASGTITNWIAMQEAQKNYEKIIAQKSNVTDEDTLRQLLLLDEELEITVTGDMEIKTGFTVNGTKTLKGDGRIAANLGILEPISILKVSPESKLTMDGLVIDGNGTAIGVQVEYGAELTYLSGEITYAGTYGIATNGLVTIKDVTISNSTTAAVDAGFRSEVYFQGGQFIENRHIGVYVEAQAYMEISEAAVIGYTSGQGIRNRGELVINGGTFYDIGKYVISNHGELTIDYTGSEDKYIEMTNIGSGVVYNNNTGTAIVKDVHATNMGADAMKCVGGTLTVENCVLENSKAHGFYVSFGEVTIKAVKVSDVAACGIYTLSPAVISLDNLELENVGTRGIMSKGATITGNNVSIKNVGTYGISNERSSEGTPAKAEYTNLTISGCGKNSIFHGGVGTNVTITNATLGETPRTNVYVGAGELTLNNVEILGSQADDCAAISIASKGTCTLAGDSKIHGQGKRGVNISGIFNMTGGEIYGYNPQKESGGAVRLYKGGVFNMSGGSIHDNDTKYAAGAVYLNEYTTFKMTGGMICNNTATTSGGAVYVSANSTFDLSGGEIYGNEALTASSGAIYAFGTVNMSGGNIYNNTSASVGGGINLNSKVDSKTGERLYGTLNLTGGKIYNNTATTNGGGLHVSNGTIANLTGGSIYDNVAGGKGSGINDNGYVTLGGSFYLGDNRLALSNNKITVKIEGSSLGAHTLEQQLLLQPAVNSAKGVVVAECESEANAAELVKLIQSGSSVYTLSQDGKNIIIGGYVAADMSMKDADTVYVSTFEELKEAVQGTTTSRKIVICDDIVMEGVVTVPEGTTVSITDDGKVRTLTRAEGMANTFFNTPYGTGLIVKATKEGNLVLSGAAEANESYKQLLYVRGTTVVNGVVFRDNGNPEKVKDGIFIYHKDGELTVTASTFTGGYGSAGGAVCVENGTAVITDSVFNENTSKYGGGAIRVKTGATLTIDGSTFNKNAANSVGGAINNDGGTLNVTDSTFTNNTSVGTSGAINLTNNATARIADSVFDGNGSTGDEAGAIKVNKSHLVLENTTFTKNTTPKVGGAILVKDKSTLEVIGGTFAENTCASTGGAIKMESGTSAEFDGTIFIANKTTGTTGGAIDAYKATVTLAECVFEGNEAATHGGAIYSNTGSSMTLTGCEFYANKANTKTTVNAETGEEKTTDGNGGAIFVGGESFTATGCIFGAEDMANTSVGSGGAVYVNKTASFTDCDFIANETRKESGGAVYVKGTFTASECNFSDNIAKKLGGAVYLNDSGVAEITDSAFTSNMTTAYEGGAIANKGTVTITDSSFTDNKANSNGGVIDVNGKATTLTNCTYEGNEGKIGADIYIRRGKSIFINGGTFTNGIVGYQAADDSTNMGQAIVSGTILDANFVYAQEGVAGILIGENGIAGSDITITPLTYTSGQIVIGKASEALEDSVLVAAAGFMQIADNADAPDMAIVISGAYGIMQANCVQNASDNVLYSSLQEAIDAAENGDILYVLENLTINDTITIAGKEITITNLPGTEVTLKRAAAMTEAMFIVEGGSSLTLGVESDTAALVIDGGYDNETKTGAKGKSLIYNNGTFTLEVNATLCNANTGAVKSNSTYDGAAIYSKDLDTSDALDTVVTLKGNVRDNTAYNGAVYIYNGKLYIEGGEYTGNTAAGQGGAVYVGTNTLEAKIVGATMTTNAVTNANRRGGAIYLQGGETLRADGLKTELTLENCNIYDNVTESAKAADPGCDIIACNNTILKLKNNTNLGIVQQRWTPAVEINFGGETIGPVTLIPISYDKGTQIVTFETEEIANYADEIVVRKVTAVTESETTTLEYDENTYYIDEAGCIQYRSAKVGTTYYNTLMDAVDAITAGTESGTTIEVICDVALSEPIVISKDMTITNAAGSDITLTRTAMTSALFTVEAGSTLTLGSADTANTFTIDGGSEAGVTAPSLVSNAGTFVLQANAVMQNAATGAQNETSYNNASYNGGALYNTGTAALYGNFKGNSAYRGGAVYNEGTLTVTGGTYSNNEAANEAGAIFVSETGVADSAKNCTFTLNTAGTNGGAIAVRDGGSFNGEDLEFLSNTATGQKGGAIFVTGNTSVVTLTVSENPDKHTFVGNTAVADTEGHGGAIAVNCGTVQVTGYTFMGNTATEDGGAVYLNGWTSGDTDNIAIGNFTDCVFGGTEAEQINKAASEGGAIYTSGLLTATGCQFIGNEATGSGGAVYVNYKNATVSEKVEIEKCQFTDNKSTGSAGGAIYNKGKLTVSNNCTFTGNYAKTSGGAIWFTGTKATGNISDTTFTKNTAGNFGGAIDVNGQASALVLENCTFDSNKAKADGSGHAINVRKGYAVEINGITFKGSNPEICLAGASNMGTAAWFGEITGNVTIKYQPIDTTFTQETGIYVGGELTFAENSGITLVPSVYATGYQVINYSGSGTAENLATAANVIKIASNADGDWYLTHEGKLVKSDVVAQVGTDYYTSITDAIAVLDSADEATVYVLQDCEIDVTAAVAIASGKTLTITNAPGRDVVVTRTQATSLFSVASGGTLTIGSADTTGTIAIDGGYDNEVATSVTASSLVSNAGTFVLQANATIQNAYAGTENANANKGGALNNAGAAELYGDFSNNRGYNGGVIYNATTGEITVYGGAYDGNTATKNGGVFAGSGTLTVKDGTFTNNIASGGGGVFYFAGTLTIDDGEFSGNQSTTSTGGVVYSSGTLDINGGTYTGNKAATGGGVVNVAGTADISGVTMTGNSLTTTSGSTFYGGAAIYVGSGKTLSSLTDSNIYNNTSNYDSKVPSCDVRFANQTTYDKATVSGITADDKDDSTIECFYLCINTTKKYFDEDGNLIDY